MMLEQNDGKDITQNKQFYGSTNFRTNKTEA